MPRTQLLSRVKQRLLCSWELVLKSSHPVTSMIRMLIALSPITVDTGTSSSFLEVEDTKISVRFWKKLCMLDLIIQIVKLASFFRVVLIVVSLQRSQLENLVQLRHFQLVLKEVQTWKRLARLPTSWQR